MCMANIANGEFSVRLSFKDEIIPNRRSHDAMNDGKLLLNISRARMMLIVAQ